MINNYYTLLHLVSEWQTQAGTSALAQPFTQTKNELVLPFEPVSDTGVRGRPFAAVVSCEPSANALFFKETYPRARRNSKDIFEGVEGALVGRVAVHPSDRQIRIDLRTGVSLILQFFGSRANVVLVGADGIVADAFLRSRDMIGSTPDAWPSSAPEIPTAKSIADRIVAHPDLTLVAAMKKWWPSSGPVLLREVLFRSGMDGGQTVSRIDPRSLTTIAEVCRLVMGAASGPPHATIYYRGDEGVEFAPIPLSHLAELRAEEHPSVSEGVRYYIANSRSRSDLTKRVGRLVSDLRAETQQADTTLRRIRAEIPDPGESERLERYGKLLHAHLTTLIKGQREAIVEDLFSPGREITAIALDPHLTPAKNAERYFEKSRKLRTAVFEQHARIDQLERRLTAAASLLMDAEEIASMDAWEAFTALHGGQLRALGVRADAGAKAVKEETRPPFRVFVVDGGFRVWAGKSGENNDLLTTRHTAKNDLWFHVRGAGGSHVVLKVGTGRGEVSRRAKDQAAAIAAFYSKMKKAAHVPVAMCEGKYVRKPRGASIGTVVIERETVLFVTPALPENPEEVEL